MNTKNFLIRFLWIICTAFFLISCQENQEPPIPHEEPEKSVELSAKAFQQISDAMLGFATFWKKIDSAAKAELIPSVVINIWSKIQANFPPSFKFANHALTDDGKVSVPITEINNYLEYIKSFEPLFDAIEDTYDQENITEILRIIVLQFELATNINITPIKEGEIAEISTGRTAMKRSYCCCCWDNSLPKRTAVSVGSFNCGSFRARSFWAKIRCKLWERVIGACSDGSLDLIRSDGRPCSQAFFDDVTSSTSPLSQERELTGFYRGSNNGNYYLRQVGLKVYWFGEDSIGVWSNVMKGTLDSDTLRSEFYDVPKGSSINFGPITFVVSVDGKVFTKISGGGNGVTFTRSSLPILLPNRREAGFSQKGNINQLDGVWLGDDGAYYYFRQVEGTVSWFGESEFISGTRPIFTNVAFGSRSGNRIQMEWADVPKGRLEGKGILSLLVIGPNEIVKISGPEFGGTRWIRQ